MVDRLYLDDLVPNRLIGRVGLVARRTRSLDCNPLDYFLGGHLEQFAYANQVSTVHVLREDTKQVFSVIQNTLEILDRVRQPMVKQWEVCATV